MTTEQPPTKPIGRMSDAELFNADHRPWPIPRSPWRMFQSWRDLLFAHWPVEPAALAHLMPRGLEAETFEGHAWVTIAPFWMADVALRPSPALPGLATFPEMNTRTNVTIDNKPGVYFFSLDAGNRIAVEVARAWYHLPYLKARMSIRTIVESIHYDSERTDRRGNPAELRCWYRPTGPVYRSEPGSLDEWLTERYCLYAADRREHIYRAEITHQPWPLQPAEASFSTNTMLAAHGIDMPDSPPLLHFARRLDVRAWQPVRIG
jgi:uncharacterized protein YqjF (DUF2071 family)